MTHTATPHHATHARAVTIGLDSSIRVEATPVDRASLLSALSDYNTETLFIDEGRAAILTGASTTVRDAAINPRATQIAERFLPGFAKTGRLKGTAIVVGLNTDPDSDEIYQDVPAEVVQFVENMWGAATVVV